MTVAAIHTVFASGKSANRPFGRGIFRYVPDTGRKPYTWDDQEWAAAAFGENEREYDRVAAEAEAINASTNSRLPV